MATDTIRQTRVIESRTLPGCSRMTLRTLPRIVVGWRSCRVATDTIRQTRVIESRALPGRCRMALRTLSQIVVGWRR
jgi:hypothetical protein